MEKPKLILFLSVTTVNVSFMYIPQIILLYFCTTAQNVTISLRQCRCYLFKKYVLFYTRKFSVLTVHLNLVEKSNGFALSKKITKHCVRHNLFQISAQSAPETLKLLNSLYS